MDQLYTSITCLEVLLRSFWSQRPQHWPIPITTVDLDSLHNLIWSDKVKLLSQVHSFVNELCPFNPTVLVHGNHLVQSVAQVVSTDYPGQLLAIQLYRGRVHHIGWSSTEKDALGFGFTWVGVSGENQGTLPIWVGSFQRFIPKYVYKLLF